MTDQTRSHARVEIDESVFAPFSPEFTRDPIPSWQRLLSDYPVAWHKGLKKWVVSPHDLVTDILRGRRFSRSRPDGERALPKKAEADKNDFDRMLDHHLLIVNPAAHIRLRRLTGPAFSVAMLPWSEEKVGEAVVGVFDELGQPQEFNVHTELSARIPVRCVMRILDAPDDAEELFAGLAYNLSRAADPFTAPHERWSAARGTLTGLAYLREMIAERRGRDVRGGDFLGTLTGTVIRGDRLSDWEIVALIAAMVAGDSATDLHTYAILELLSHPDQHQLLLEQPDLMENAIPEIIRHGAFFKTGLLRFAAEDVEIGGQQIRVGEGILAVMGAAWNDPQKWPEPRRFDITRSQKGDLSFGIGPHYCIGADLATIQGKLMVREFDRRFPAASLAGDIEYDCEQFNARRITKLVVRTNLKHPTVGPADLSTQPSRSIAVGNPIAEEGGV